LKLHGKLLKNTRIIKEVVVEKADDNLSFADLLEDCFIDLCKHLDVQVPLWLKKNTSEFAAFRKTFFTKEQFIEKVTFDRLEIRIEM
jgi:hypothetical protein